MQRLLITLSLQLIYVAIQAQDAVEEVVPQTTLRDSIIGLELHEILYFIITVVIVIATYLLAKFLLNRQIKGKTDKGIIRSLILFCLGLFGIIVIIMSIPMGDSLRNDVIGLIGIVLAAALSISSATLLGNAMAGIQLSMIKLFKPGDFVEVNEIFGRVSEKGLFHTEIQTVDRDLITLPNLLLSNNPVKVKRSSGTIITASCSLGYDVSRIKIENCLIDAAKKAGLTDPFVHITELGDFSVVYKIHGMLEKIETVISAKSKLHAMMLDTLHEAGIEIVSPNFMNQRQIGDVVFIPKKANKKEIAQAKIQEKTKAEKLIFDKAEEAQSIESRKEKITEIDSKIKELNAELKVAETPEQKDTVQQKITKWSEIKTKMIESVDQKVEDIDKK